MNKALPIIAVLGLLLSTTALAAASKRMTHSIEATAFTDVQLEMSVGEMVIEVYDGDTIELDIELIAERRWFSFRRGDVDDVELDRREQGESLFLGIDQDNLDQTWRVRLPAHLAVDLAVGVGDIQIDNFSNSLLLDLGVVSVHSRTFCPRGDFLSTVTSHSPTRGYTNEKEAHSGTMASSDRSAP